MYDPCDARRYGSVALMVLYVPSCFGCVQKARGESGARGRTVSISMTVRNAFSEMPEMGAMKLPAAPAAQHV
jgi:hypothetical protein